MAGTSQDGLYREAAAEFGAALERLARCYENDPDKRRDLMQDIHLALWRSLEGFDGNCSLRTWIYRVAHNTAASYVIRERRAHAGVFVGLEDLERVEGQQPEMAARMERSEALERLLGLIHQLQPLDRQVILSFLEGLDAPAIAEITGLSPGNAAVKVHRIKNILTRRFQEVGHDR
jgi:RNA polymerase sigma-70 factor (ECF subfamily)